nr:hypothetical protein [Tanacetum cinerariifolium]
MAIEESKDLSTLSLDKLIGNLKVYDVVLEKDLEVSKYRKEKYKSLALKARQVLSEEDASSSNSNDDEYAMSAKEDKKEKEDRTCFKCGDPNHFISNCPKHSFGDQKAFVVRCWSDSGDDPKKEEICLMAQSNEVQSDTPYYSSSFLDNESRQDDFGVDAAEDFKEYTLRDYYCWLKTYCCWYKLKLLDDAADIKLRLLEQSAAAGIR